MLGLLYKDTRANLRWLLLTLGIVLFFNLVMFSADVSSHDIDFIGMRAVYLLLYSSVFILTGAFALNYIQTDERKKWGYYVASLPHGIARQVISKYIFVLLTLLFTLGVCCLQNCMVRLFNDEAKSIVSIFVILMSIVLIMLAFELPCAIAFGSKYGSYVKAGIFVLLVLIAAVYLMFGDISWMGSEEEFSDKFMDKISNISKSSNAIKFALSALPLYCISCFISVKLYLGGIERMEK